MNVMIKQNIMIEKIIGYTGTVISSASFMPQVIKIWKTKSAHDLSMMTLFLLSANATIWSIYGIMKEAKPLWITNLLMLTMVMVMIAFKIMYKNNSLPRSKRVAFT